MKRLKVKTLYQNPKSVDCGPVCVQMVLKYFGIERSVEDLKKGMSYEEAGTYFFENGSLLLREGLDVELITANPMVFEREVYGKLKKKEELFKHLTKFAKKRTDQKTAVKLFKQFVTEGGRYTIAIPEFSHIKNALDRDKLVLATLHSNALGGDEGGGYHSVVVSGYKDNAVYIHNPSPGSKTGWFPVKNFLFAVHASTCFDIDNGSLLVAGK